MSTFTSSGAFATLKANNSHLYNSSRSKFAIHQNNGFIKVRSPKFSINKLSATQKQQLKEKLRSYATSEQRSVILNSAITLAVSAGIIVLSSQILNNLM